MKDHINPGLDSKIVDSDGGANVATKAEKLKSAGVSNPNLKSVPPYPADGWESNLASLPMFTFGTIRQHFTARSEHDWEICGHQCLRELTGPCPLQLCP